jgi:type VI secretion system secreted protein Hcp
MTGPLPLPAFALLGILLLVACGDAPNPMGTQGPEREEEEQEEEEPVRDYASSTPVGALAGFLDLHGGGPGAEAAVDFFLKIPDIPGESQDADHEDEIDILAIDWTIAVELAPGDDGQLAAMARLGEIVLTKRPDLASHELTHVVQQGTAIPEMDLAVRRTHAAGEDYLQIQLTDVLVSSVQPSGTPGAPTDVEEVTFTFQGVTWSLPGLEPEVGAVDTAIPLDGLVAFLDLDVPGLDPQPGPMSVYIKIPDIDGDSEASGHEGHIDIESFSWPTRVHVDAQAGTGGVELQDIVVTKREDSTSRALADAADGGTVFPEIVIYIRKDGGTAAPVYHNITLKRGVLSSHTPGSSADEVPTETISLNYEEVS